MFALHRTIPLAALVFGKLIVPRLLSLGQHDGWRLIQLGAAGAVAQRLEAAGWALCFGHGPAGGFFVCPSILLKSIVEEGCDRERSNKRCTRAAAAACARTPRARECACVPAVLLVLREDAGAAEKGHYRVRHFAGVVAFPVVKRQRVDMATAVYDGVARARRAGARRALHPLGGGWAGARATTVAAPTLPVHAIRRPY